MKVHLQNSNQHRFAATAPCVGNLVRGTAVTAQHQLAAGQRMTILRAVSLLSCMPLPPPLPPSRLADSVGLKADPAGLAATPARNRGAAAAMVAADGTKASPATPQSAPRSAFKARTNVSNGVHAPPFLCCCSRPQAVQQASRHCLVVG